VKASFGQNVTMPSEESATPISAVTVSELSLRRDAWRHARPAGTVELLAQLALGWDAGADASDRAIDAGGGVLLLIDDSAPSMHARAIAALYAGGDATSVIPTQVNDLEWMRMCADVRDAMVVLRPLIAEPTMLLSHDNVLASQVSAIVEAAARRTPIVLVGTVPHIAAMAAARVAAQSSTWVFLGLSDDDAAAEVARKRLGSTPWCALQWRPQAEAAEAIVRSLIADLDGVD
jgi:hypothetical protein